MKPQFRFPLQNIFEKDTTPLSCSAGSVIFSEGQKRDCMYVVKAGEVDLFVRGQLAETVSVDGFLGELAMIDNSPRTATAVAKTDCTLIPINEKQFEFLSQEVPLFSLAIMRAMVSRIRSRTARFGVMAWPGQQPARDSIERFLDHASGRIDPGLEGACA
jgi:CRP/FNR family transcriptional regulator, cyclic AMP receptor protein